MAGLMILKVSSNLNNSVISDTFQGIALIPSLSSNSPSDICEWN